MEYNNEKKQPYSKIAELLGEPQPKNEDIYITEDGVTVSRKGKPNLDKLVEKVLTL